MSRCEFFDKEFNICARFFKNSCRVNLAVCTREYRDKYVGLAVLIAGELVFLSVKRQRNISAAIQGTLPLSEYLFKRSSPLFDNCIYPQQQHRLQPMKTTHRLYVTVPKSQHYTVVKFAPSANSRTSEPEEGAARHL